MIRRMSIHMVGIGGAGMSGLAFLLHKMGFPVTGSDLRRTAVTEDLKRAGIKVASGHHRDNIPQKALMLVYSSAVIISKNVEVLEARRRGMAVLRRGSVLAQISRLKRAITVSGTHGKSTTSSMAGWVLNRARLSPTVIVGGEIRNLQAHAVMGHGDLFVMETDESDGSFLETSPWIAVVTNVDNDHLEHYGSMKNIEEAFLRHLRSVPFYGYGVVCGEDPILRERIIPKLNIPLVKYGLGAGMDCRAVDIAKGESGYTFRIAWRGRLAAKTSLSVPGIHNVLNSLAAASAAHLAGAPWPEIAKALPKYKGIRRRMEILGHHGGILFLDDYGHHPTEIAATLAAVRDFYKGRRLVVCFQPHRYSRTKMLAAAYGPAFSGADFVWVCPIYSASEEPMEGVSEQLVLNSLKKAGVACAGHPGRASELRRHLQRGDIFITVGAGDVWKIGEDLSRRMEGE